MSFTDWLQRKADESSHNEIISFMIVVLGMNIAIGGLIVTTIMIGEPNFFSLFTQQPINMSVALGPILALVGFFLAAIGFILTFHHDRKKSWYLGQIRKSDMFTKKKDRAKTTDELMEEYARGKEN